MSKLNLDSNRNWVEKFIVKLEEAVNNILTSVMANLSFLNLFLTDPDLFTDVRDALLKLLQPITILPNLYSEFRRNPWLELTLENIPTGGAPVAPLEISERLRAWVVDRILFEVGVYITEHRKRHPEDTQKATVHIRWHDGKLIIKITFPPDEEAAKALTTVEELRREGFEVEDEPGIRTVTIPVPVHAEPL